jgi:hypothetical protein
VGAVAYRLKLPEESRVHPVFHVSLLKKVVGSYREKEALPDDLDGEKDDAYEPDIVLAQRTIQVQGEEVRQVLVKWKGQNSEEATWEDAVMMTSRFPDFSLEDKAILSDGSVVRNEANTVGSRERNEPRELLTNHEVGPREWLVYSRRGKRVSKV